MQFSSLSELIQMGGQGIFVWSSYGITFMVIAINVLSPLLRQRALRKEIKHSVNREARQHESNS
jgi:heme exporter protein D